MNEFTTIVNDGQFEWAANSAELLAALDDLGWEARPHIPGSVVYTEPANADPAEAYTELCGSVQSVAGEGSPDEITDEMRDSSSVFRFRPDLGRDKWEMTT